MPRLVSCLSAFLVASREERRPVYLLLRSERFGCISAVFSLVVTLGELYTHRVVGGGGGGGRGMRRVVSVVGRE